MNFRRLMKFEYDHYQPMKSMNQYPQHNYTDITKHST